MLSSGHPITSMPLYYVADVWHVGSFDAADKNTHGSSQEGTGLSVSECPDDWCSIVKLGGHPTWHLTRPGAAFLDYHEMTQVHRNAIIEWGIAKGYLEMRSKFKLSYLDSEYDETRFQLLDSREDAETEAADLEDASIEEVSVPDATEAMSARLRFKADAIAAEDFVATFYVEDETDLDGVWWHDTYDPASLSAPRGVIVLRALPSWQRQLSN